MSHPLPENTPYWEQLILLVDMNAFFASIEQRDHPEWAGRPIAITNGKQGSTIITASYEARAYGIHTGMRLPEAKRLCPQLIRIPSRPERYAETSTAIMEGLQSITPTIEIFSVDEAFLDATHCQRLLGTPQQIAEKTQQVVFESSGLLCSIGASGDKTTAKFAAKQEKPNGLTLIPPWEAEARLHDAPVTALCGINKGIGGFLQRYGVRTCGEMKQIPIHLLAQRFGNLGRRIWLMAQGLDPEPVTPHIQDPKSIGHGKVIPPNTTDAETILTYLHHMAEKVGSRLRRHRMESSRFYIGIKCDLGWLSAKPRSRPTSDGRTINRLARTTFHQLWQGEGIHQVQVTALNPVAEQFQQLDLFAETEPTERDNSAVNQVVDQVNQRFGEFALAPATLLNRSSMPNVISPAWRPSGHRKTL